MDCHALTDYPFAAFENRNLLDIDLNFNRLTGGALKRVKNFAFYKQNNVSDVDITHQSVDYIERNAFTFEAESTHILHVFLDNNRLNATSFEFNVFNDTNRAIELFVRNNSIEYLDEKVFQPFFAANKLNKLDVSDNPLVLDCRMAWLVNTSSNVELMRQILGGETTNEKHIIFLEPNDFMNCL